MNPVSQKRILSNQVFRVGIAISVILHIMGFWYFSSWSTTFHKKVDSRTPIKIKKIIFEPKQPIPLTPPSPSPDQPSRAPTLSKVPMPLKQASRKQRSSVAPVKPSAKPPENQKIKPQSPVPSVTKPLNTRRSPHARAAAVAFVSRPVDQIPASASPSATNSSQSVPRLPQISRLQPAPTRINSSNHLPSREVATSHPANFLEVSSSIHSVRPAPSFSENNISPAPAAANNRTFSQITTKTPSVNVRRKQPGTEVLPAMASNGPVGLYLTNRQTLPGRRSSPIRLASIPSDFIEGETGENAITVQGDDPSKLEAGSTAAELGELRDGFFSSVWGRISKAKYYPRLARKRGFEGQPVVSFKLSDDGILLEAAIIEPSAHEILDEAALDAVKSASPYPPIPEALHLDSIRFKLPISFILSEP